MNRQDQAQSDPASLRKRAEEMFRANKPRALESISPEEAERTLYELQVHQIELQMQNEELRRAQVELDATRARYFDLYDLAPVGYLTVSEKGLILEANLTAARLLRVQRGALVKRSLAGFVVCEDGNAYYLHFKRLRETGLQQVLEARMARPGGARFWARLEAVKAEDAEGAPVFRVVISDITERKHAEEVIQRSDLMRLSFDAIIVSRPDGAIESWNRGAEQLYGYSENEAFGHIIHDLLKTTHPVPWPKIEARLRESGQWEGELCHRTKEGREVVVSARMQLLRGTDGVERILEVNRDITERKRAEELLRNSEERLRLLGDNLPDSVVYQYTYEPDGAPRFLYISAGVERLNGVKAEEVLEDAGALHRQFLPGDLPALLEAERLSARDLSIFERELQMRLPDGQLRWMHLRSCPRRLPDGQVIWDGVQTDITAHKRAGEALRESEGRLQLFIEHAPAALAMFDREMRYLHVSRRWMADYRLGDRDLRGLSHYEVFPEVSEQWKETHRRGLAGEVLSEEADRFDRADGSVQWVRWEIRPWRERTGEVGGIVIFAEEITERKRTEEALRKSEERLDLATQAADLGTWDWDVRKDLLVWSPRCLALFGLASDIAMSYQRFLEAIHSEDRERIDKAVRTALERHEDYGVEMRTIWPDGSLHWVISRGRAHYDHSGQPVRMSGAALDITERKQAEQALLRSEKLASVGRMAASIAHEINNPLAAVVNTIFLAKTNADEPESVRKFLDLADDELMRIAHITRQTLGFYRESTFPTTVAINSIMDSALDMLRGKIRAKDTRIERRYDGDLQVTAVPGELRQVFSNLLANSLDAMDQEGAIKLRISRSTCVNSGKSRIRVTVADNGGGIDAATLPHIFEPLFTTKEATGAGLGLWVSKQLIDKHGGAIQVRSSTRAHRRGTVLSIILPAEAAPGV